MSKLLSNEELRGSIRDAITGIDTENENNLWTPGQIERIENLINTQKRLYAESVIGEDEDMAKPETEIDSYEAFKRNELRAEQRERIK